MKTTLYKTYGLYTQEEMKEWKRNTEAETIDDIFMMESLNWEFDYLMDEIRHSNLKNEILAVNGVLGLWDGKHTIKEEKGNLEHLIKKCVGHQDNFEIFEENGKIRINSYHHDGTNEFVITRPKGKAISFLEEVYGAC